MSPPVKRNRGGHGIGPRSSLRRHRGEEGPTPRECGCAPSVGEEPEVADADEAAREDLEEEATEELGGRERHRPHAVPPGGVFPPACREPSRTETHPVGVHADQPVIGDGHAVGLPVGRQVERPRDSGTWVGPATGGLASSGVQPNGVHDPVVSTERGEQSGGSGTCGSPARSRTAPRFRSAMCFRTYVPLYYVPLYDIAFRYTPDDLQVYVLLGKSGID